MQVPNDDVQRKGPKFINISWAVGDDSKHQAVEVLKPNIRNQVWATMLILHYVKTKAPSDLKIQGFLQSRMCSLETLRTTDIPE